MDFPSNGEWRGKSSSLKSLLFGQRIVVYRRNVREAPRVNFLEQNDMEGEIPVCLSVRFAFVMSSLRVAILGNGLQIGW